MFSTFAPNFLIYYSEFLHHRAHANSRRRNNKRGATNKIQKNMINVAIVGWNLECAKLPHTHTHTKTKCINEWFLQCKITRTVLIEDWRLFTIYSVFGVYGQINVIQKNKIKRNEWKKTWRIKNNHYLIWSLNSVYYDSHYINWMLYMFGCVSWTPLTMVTIDDSFSMTPKQTHTLTHTFIIKNRTRKKNNNKNERARNKFKDPLSTIKIAF